MLLCPPCIRLPNEKPHAYFTVSFIAVFLVRNWLSVCMHSCLLEFPVVSFCGSLHVSATRGCVAPACTVNTVWVKVAKNVANHCCSNTVGVKVIFVLFNQL